MNWLIPENELDREQRKFLDNLITQKDNEHIVGFPGSGKTILLLYAAKKLKDKEPDAKIIFVEFTHALIKMIEAAIQQLPYHDIKVVTYYDFYNKIIGKEIFDYILCDEVQDVPKKVIDKMKQSAKRVIIAGDPNQSIYKEDPRWSLPPCTQKELKESLSPYTMSLTVIHRLSRFVINAVDKFLPNMKIISGQISMMKTHPQIRLWKAGNQLKEVHAIMEDAKSYLNVGDSVGILFPTHNKIQKFANKVLSDVGKPEWEISKDKYYNPKYEELNSLFDTYDIPMQYVANGYGNFTSDKDKITLTTYHSSKGLDFDRVYLPFCNHVDQYSNYAESDKTLFMVALTRSRKDLIISFSGELNHFVVTFKDDCKYRNLETDSMPQLFGSFEDANAENQSEKAINNNIFEW